jgi:aspartate aminotransferase, putative
LPVIEKVETELANDKTLNHEYLAQLGDVSFSEQATLLLLGANCQQIKDGRVSSNEAKSCSFV